MKSQQWLFKILRKQNVTDGLTHARMEGCGNRITPTNTVCRGINTNLDNLLLMNFTHFSCWRLWSVKCTFQFTLFTYGRLSKFSLVPRAPWTLVIYKCCHQVTVLTYRRLKNITCGWKFKNSKPYSLGIQILKLADCLQYNLNFKWSVVFSCTENPWPKQL